MPMNRKEEKGRLCFQQIQGYAYFTTSCIAKYHAFLDIAVLFAPYRKALFLQTMKVLYHRHPTLRATIHTEAGQVYQTINEQTDTADYIDYYDLPKGASTDSFRAAAKTIACEKMGLDGGFLSRIAVLVYPDKQAECLFFLHHLIADQMSMAILEHQFITTYTALSDNPLSLTDPLVEKTGYSVLDYAQWQYEHWDKIKSRCIAYWHTQLGDYNERLLPTLLRHSPTYSKYKEEDALNEVLNDSPSGFYVQIWRGKQKDAFYQLASRLQQSIAAVFAGLYGLLPYYRTGTEKSLLAMVVRDSYYPQIRELVGPCTGAIYIAKEWIRENCTFESYFQSVFFTIIQSAKYLITDHVSVGLPGRRLRLNCDFFLNVFPSFLHVKLDKAYYTGHAYADSHIYYALECNIYEQDDHIYILWGYNKDLYSHNQVVELSLLLEKLMIHINAHYKSEIKKQHELFN